MLACEDNGNYVEADSLRQKAIIQQKLWEQQTVSEMTERHRAELAALYSTFLKNGESCDSEWKARIDQFNERASA